MTAPAPPAPLAGRRVVVTRDPDGARVLAARLAALGAVPVLCPVLAFGPPPDAAAFDAALRDPGFDWVVFTSATGVRAALDRAQACGLTTPAWTRARVAAIGTGTAEALQQRGVSVAFLPGTFVGEALGDELPDVAGRRVLLLRAEAGRAVLCERLEARGADVADVAAYTTVPAPLSDASRKALEAGVDAVTFTSASTVQGFVGALGPQAPALMTHAAVVTIGPVTSAALRAAGLRVDAEAPVATLDGLLGALVQHFSVPA